MRPDLLKRLIGYCSINKGCIVLILAVITLGIHGLLEKAENKVEVKTLEELMR